MVVNPLKTRIAQRKTDKTLGIPSYCTAQSLVIMC